MRKAYILGIAVALVSSTCSSALSQTMATDSDDAGATLEPIIVTAQKRAENLQKVPITGNAYSSDTLATANVKSVQDLTTLVSGFTGPGESGGASPHIRGVGSQITRPGIENSVALYVDGVYIGATSPALLKLSNVNQVLVLKGPQGTLFGRNTTGGLVQITTRDPNDTPEIAAEIGYGNYSTTSGWIYVNSPLSPGISTNLSVQASNQGKGWGRNLFTGAATSRQDLDLSIRNKWNLDLGEATKLQLIGDYENRDELGYFAFRSIPGARNLFGYVNKATGWDVDNNTDDKDRTEAWGLSGRLIHDFGFATLTNTAAYRRTVFKEFDHDVDASPIPFVAYDQRFANSQWTEELQLSSPDGGKLKWTAGLFYYDATDEVRIDARYSLPTFPYQRVTFPDKIESRSYSGYAQASYNILPATTLTAGLRYTHDDHSKTSNPYYVVRGAIMPGAMFGSPPIDASFGRDVMSWRFAIAQQLSDQAMIYASYNKGVKPGGYDPGSANGRPYSDETLSAYEVGTKITFLDDRARLSLSAFYYDYSNIQVSGFTLSSAYIYNGAGARMYGADVDFEVRPVTNLTLNASMEALRSEFTSFPNAATYTPLPAGGYVVGTGSVAGNALPFAPNFTGSLGVNYSVPTRFGTLDLSSTYSYNSGYFGNPDHSTKQDSYGLLGASIQYTSPSERYYIRAWGSNLTDRQVKSNLGVIPVGGFVRLNAPRTFGITLGMKLTGR